MGIKDFVEGKRSCWSATGNISEFLRRCTLCEDLDNDKGDDDPSGSNGPYI